MLLTCIGEAYAIELPLHSQSMYKAAGDPVMILQTANRKSATAAAAAAALQSTAALADGKAASGTATSDT
jgi:hypothetical protein